MKDTNINVGLNSADCIKEQPNFTNMIYHNICNGSTSVVPTGVFDYIVFAIVMSFVLLIFIKLVQVMFRRD